MEYFIRVGDTDVYAEITPKGYKSLLNTLAENNLTILEETKQRGELDGSDSIERVKLIRGALPKDATV